MDRFLTENHAMSIGFGADFIGATTTLGYKYFDGKIKKDSGTFLDKCFFLFECDTHPYVGLSLQYAGKTSLTVTEDGLERKWETDPKWLALGSFGLREIFKNDLTFDLEISYRGILSGGKATQTAGISKNDLSLIESGYRGLGFNVGLGYLF